jgi:hypothetical protein
MRYIDGMIKTASFMMIGKDVEGILRFCLSHFKGCNVGITGGSNL